MVVEKDRGLYRVFCAGEDQAQKPKEAKDAKNLNEKGKKLKEDMDKLVDEIDEVLEENAEEFVKNYIQRGGE